MTVLKKTGKNKKMSKNLMSIVINRAEVVKEVCKEFKFYGSKD